MEGLILGSLAIKVPCHDMTGVDRYKDTSKQYVPTVLVSDVTSVIRSGHSIFTQCIWQLCPDARPTASAVGRFPQEGYFIQHNKVYVGAHCSLHRAAGPIT